MFKWNNSLKPFQEKHFQKGQVHLKLAIIYVGVQPFAHNSSGSCFFLEKKMLLVSVRNCLIFQRGSELVLRSKAAKSLASQKVHHRVISLSSAECYTECSPGLWTVSSVDLEKELAGALQTAQTEKNSEQSKKKRQRIVGLDWSPGLCC